MKSHLRVGRTSKHEVRVCSPDQQREGTKGKRVSSLALKLLLEGRNNPSTGQK
jgi:hypothetical protein